MSENFEAVKHLVDLAVQRMPGAAFRRGEWWALCPFHADRHADNFAYRPETGSWFCHTCNRGGGVLDLAPRLGIDAGGARIDPAEMAAIRAEREAVAQQLAESKRRQSLALAAWWQEARLQDDLAQHDEVLAMLERDGVSRQAASTFGFGRAVYGAGGRGVPALAIPWTRRGETRAVQYRLLAQDTPGGRYRWHEGSRPTVFNSDAVTDPHDDTMVVVEGAKKAAALWSHGLTSVCALVNKGGWRTEYAPPFGRFDRVIFALDPDAHTEAIAAALTIPKARVAMLTMKPDDYLVTTGGDVDGLWAILESARRAD